MSDSSGCPVWERISIFNFSHKSNSTNCGCSECKKHLCAYIVDAVMWNRHVRSVSSGTFVRARSCFQSDSSWDNFTSVGFRHRLVITHYTCRWRCRTEMTTACGGGLETQSVASIQRNVRSVRNAIDVTQLTCLTLRQLLSLHFGRLITSAAFVTLRRAEAAKHRLVKKPLSFYMFSFPVSMKCSFIRIICVTVL